MAGTQIACLIEEVDSPNCVGGVSVCVCMRECR